MGIPSYFSFIVKNYPRIIKNIGSFDKKNIENLFLDSNSIIYDAVSKNINNFDEYGSQLFEERIINEIILKIEDYIKFINPTKLIYIAFDGVAPLAKMKQQRIRRHKSIILSSSTPKWNTNKITPGTEFMNNLSISLNEHFNGKQNKYKVKNIIVSCSDETGEGEHKIMQYLRENDVFNDISVIYGLDSDLIMLSIFHTIHCKNIYVFREAPAFISSSIPKNMLNDDAIYFMDIPYLKESILNELEVSDEHRVFDYVFFCFFLGNDFLPHFPALNIRTNGFDILYNAYTKLFKYTNKYLIKKDFTIDWIQLNKYIKYISNIEEKIFQNEFQSRDKLEKRNYAKNTDEERENYILNIPTKFRMIEKTINPFEDYWEKRYYKYLFQKGTNVKDICMNYVDGLTWVFNYYIGNKCSFKWKYNYDYGPLLKDLIKYFPHFTMDENLPDNNYLPVKDTTQLAYVLPFKDLHLLPREKCEKIKKDYLKYYKTNLNASWAYLKFMWEAHPHLQEIPLEVLDEWDTF